MSDRKSLIKISSLVGLQGIIDAVNKLEKAINNTSSYLFRDNVTPSGTIDGANKDFNVPDSPNPALSLRIYLDDEYQHPTDDYSLSGPTITFIVAPAAGKKMRAFYRYK